MATPQQAETDKGPLHHLTLWTVVYDPPGQLRTLSRFKDPASAELLREALIRADVRRGLVYHPLAERELRAQAEKYCYVLPPGGTKHGT